jgi:hypothetical protein
MSIHYQNKKEKNFIDKIKSNNKKVIAQYLALYTECISLKKCLITLTPYDGKLSTTLEIRREFFKKLNTYKRTKTDGDLSIKYFSNIEFTKTSQPHLHIQLFYTNKVPIEKAYKAMTCSNYQNTQANNINYANDNEKTFNYVIKDYMEFDLQREQFKHHFKGVNFTTSSQKSISNSIVKYLFKTLTFKTKNRYKEILEMIDKGLIVISNKIVSIKKVKSEYKIKNRDKNNRIKFVSKSKVGINNIYIFENKVKRKKIKRYKKNIKKGKVWVY